MLRTHLGWHQKLGFETQTYSFVEEICRLWQIHTLTLTKKSNRVLLHPKSGFGWKYSIQWVQSPFAQPSWLGTWRGMRGSWPRWAFSAQMENFFLLFLSSLFTRFYLQPPILAPSLLRSCMWSRRQAPLAGTPLLVLFLDMFFFFFCCSGYIFVRPVHKEALWFSAGCWAASKLSRLASTYWRFPLQSRTFCSTIELWKRLSNW